MAAALRSTPRGAYRHLDAGREAAARWQHGHLSLVEPDVLQGFQLRERLGQRFQRLIRMAGGMAIGKTWSNHV